MRPETAQDNSARYVLPDEDPLLANLAALWVADPKLAAAIEAVHELPSYTCGPSKCGVPTLVMRTPDGRQLTMHSRHDPLDEAKQLVGTLSLHDRGMFHVHGFGLGYHVHDLFDRAGDDAILCILEPDLVMLRTAFEQRDYSSMLESGRLLFFTEPDKADFFARLSPHLPLVSMGSDTLMHAPSLHLAPEFHQQFQTWVAEFAAYCKTTMATLVINGRRTAENVAHNLPWYVATPGLSRLKDAHARKPAIIVSAGPSLRKNKHLLKDAQGKAVIIAVQTTLQPLLEIGVEPQFVTSLDYHDICTRFFEKLPPSLKTELVAEPKATSAIFRMNPGPLSLLGNEFADGLVAEMQLNKPRLRSGATVAHLAFYLAEHLGCDPIIFVGQDLGFSDGLCYAPGTSYEDVWRPELGRFCTLEMKQWEQVVRDRPILRRVPDYQGRPTYTEERLFTYLQHFERDFAQSKAKIIDATEGGVFKRGAEPMPLAEALARFCAGPIGPGHVPPHGGPDWSQLDRATACLSKRREEADEIEEVAMATLPLLERVRDNLHDQPLVNRTIAQIDRLRMRMHGLAACYQLVMNLSQNTELKKYHADRRISAANLGGAERQRHQVERDIENVRCVIEASRAFRGLVDESIARIRLAAREHNRAADAGAKSIVPAGNVTGEPHREAA